MKEKRKLIDERGFLFGKISVVDILAVVLVLALGVMVYVRFFAGGENVIGNLSDTGKVQVEYVVKAAGVKKWHLDTFQPGDLVYNGDSEVFLGTVESVRSEPAETLITTLDGRVISVPMADCYNVYVTIGAECTSSAGGYYLGGAIELASNISLQLTTRYDTVAGVVTSVG